MVYENNNYTDITLNKEEDLLEEKKFVLKYLKRNYEIKFQFVKINDVSYIRIIAQEENEIINYYYKTEMNEKDFMKQNNKLLKLYDNIQEIYEFILLSINENKISIKDIKDNVSCNLIIKDKFIGIEYSFEINLKKKDCNNKDVIGMLCNKMNELQEEKNNLNSKVNELEIINNNLNSKINELEEEKNNINSKVNELEEEKNNLNSKVNELEEEKNNLNSKVNELEEEKNNLNSKVNELEKENNNMKNEIKQLKFESDYKIIKNEDELNFIKNRLLQIPGRENSQISLSLKYRLTENGNSITIFRSICNDIPNNLTLIKTIDGARFGGYTDKAWTSSNKNFVDNNSFCFSLSQNKIYNVIRDKIAIGDYGECGPIFRDNIFYIGENNLNFGRCHKNLKSNFTGEEIDYEISGGKENFTAIEFEFYQVLFK